MRCAIDCIQYLQNVYAFDEKALTTALEVAMDDKGITIYTLVETAKQHQLNLVAMKGWWLPKQNPSIIYLRHGKVGHYIVLVSCSCLYVHIYDGRMGTRRIFKPWFYLFYSHLYILCYNVKKEVQNGS